MSIECDKSPLGCNKEALQDGSLKFVDDCSCCGEESGSSVSSVSESSYSSSVSDDGVGCGCCRGIWSVSPTWRWIIPHEGTEDECSPCAGDQTTTLSAPCPCSCSSDKLEAAALEEGSIAASRPDGYWVNVQCEQQSGSCSSSSSSSSASEPSEEKPCTCGWCVWTKSIFDTGDWVKAGAIDCSDDDGVGYDCNCPDPPPPGAYRTEPFGCDGFKFDYDIGTPSNILCYKCCGVSSSSFSSFSSEPSEASSSESSSSSSSSSSSYSSSSSSSSSSKSSSSRFPPSSSSSSSSFSSEYPSSSSSESSVSSSSFSSFSSSSFSSVSSSSFSVSEFSSSTVDDCECGYCQWLFQNDPAVTPGSGGAWIRPAYSATFDPGSCFGPAYCTAFECQDKPDDVAPPSGPWYDPDDTISVRAEAACDTSLQGGFGVFQHLYPSLDPDVFYCKKCCERRESSSSVSSSVSSSDTGDCDCGHCTWYRIDGGGSPDVNPTNEWTLQEDGCNTTTWTGTCDCAEAPPIIFGICDSSLSDGGGLVVPPPGVVHTYPVYFCKKCCDWNHSSSSESSKSEEEESSKSEEEESSVTKKSSSSVDKVSSAIDEGESSISEEEEEEPKSSSSVVSESSVQSECDCGHCTWHRVDGTTTWTLAHSDCRQPMVEVIGPHGPYLTPGDYCVCDSPPEGTVCDTTLQPGGSGPPAGIVDPPIPGPHFPADIHYCQKCCKEAPDSDSSFSSSTTDEIACGTCTWELIFDPDDPVTGFNKDMEWTREGYQSHPPGTPFVPDDDCKRIWGGEGGVRPGAHDQYRDCECDERERRLGGTKPPNAIYLGAGHAHADPQWDTGCNSPIHGGEYEFVHPDFGPHYKAWKCIVPCESGPCQGAGCPESSRSSSVSSSASSASEYFCGSCFAVYDKGRDRWVNAPAGRGTCSGGVFDVGGTVGSDYDCDCPMDGWLYVRYEDELAARGFTKPPGGYPDHTTLILPCVPKVNPYEPIPSSSISSSSVSSISSSSVSVFSSVSSSVESVVAENCGLCQAEWTAHPVFYGEWVLKVPCYASPGMPAIDDDCICSVEAMEAAAAASGPLESRPFGILTAAQCSKTGTAVTETGAL